jgi:hypothetical protein
MAQITYQANAVLNAMDEARVRAVIVFVDSGLLPSVFPTRAENVAHYADELGVKDIDYWVNEFYKIPLE